MKVAHLIRYAMERSPTHIAVYFWERNSLSVPSQVKTPGNTVDTSTWVIDSYQLLRHVAKILIRAGLPHTSRTRIVISRHTLDL